MRWYIVKQTSKGKDSNTLFPGKTQITYRGKQNTLLAWDGDFYTAIPVCPLENTARKMHKYGYKTAWSARRNDTYNHRFNNKYWESKTEIIAVEIASGKVVEVER